MKLWQVSKEDTEYLERNGWKKEYNQANELGAMSRKFGALTFWLSHYGPWSDNPDAQPYYSLSLDFDYGQMQPPTKLSFNGDGEYDPVFSIATSFNDVRKIHTQIQILKQELIDALKRLMKTILFVEIR